MKRFEVIDVVVKMLLLAELIFVLVKGDLPQFQDKAMGLRIGVYTLLSFLPLLVWFVAFRKRFAYPALISIAVTLPFLFDAAGNVFNLFDRVGWFDDALHLVNWVPWSLTFGFIVSTFKLGRLNLAWLTIGYGAVTHILWEIGEYFAFVNVNESELVGIYKDTIGDLSLSLTGSFIAGILIATVLRNAGGLRRVDTGSHSV